MKQLLITIIILVSQFPGYSQEGTRSYKPTVYNITLKETGGKILRGTLNRATPDSLYVTLSNQPTGSYYQFTPEQLDNITLRRKGVVGTSILVGAGLGILTGVVIGFAEGDDSNTEWFGMSAGEKAAMYAAGLGGVGAIVGTIVGATAKKRFIIKGKKENYRVHYNDIAQKAMTR